MTADPPTPRRERCPGSGTHYLPIYDRLPNGCEIKTLKSCPGCGRLTMIDARRPWYPAHKRGVGRTYESFWADARLKAAANRATPKASMSKRDSPKYIQRIIDYLHRVAVDTRKSAAEMDQMADRIATRLITPKTPIACCEKGPCMLCGADSPPGHVHVDLPDSRLVHTLTIGRVCSSHTLWELAKAGRFLFYIEGERARATPKKQP